MATATIRISARQFAGCWRAIFILMLVGVMAKMGGTAIAFMLAIVAHHRPAELEWHEQQ